MQTNSTTPPTSDHSRRNDAQLAHYRRHAPDAWQRLLDAMSYEERVEAERRADAAELDSFIAEWDNRSAALARVTEALTQPCPCCQPPTPPRPHVTATMIADIWQDQGPGAVVTILRTLPPEQHERLTRDYWRLMRQRGHNISLVETGIAFCVVERLAA